MFFTQPRSVLSGNGPYTVGVLRGEGIGPDVVEVALRVLSAAADARGLTFEIRYGGVIGLESERQRGAVLTKEVMEFCSEVFAFGGAVLAGPGGGRFVYELRKAFDLFCKISPLKTERELLDSSILREDYARDVDILILRENCAGLYQGTWDRTVDPAGERSATQSFGYTEKEVGRIAEVAARLAAARDGALTVAIKDGGVPTVSELWRECSSERAAEFGVRVDCVNIDLLVYRLIRSPSDFDVVLAPNMFGDVLADLGGVLLGSRGLTYSGNFSTFGAAVYQTNHGAGYDLVGKNQANPVGQVLSVAMMLRESFGLADEAEAIECAVREVWRKGWRTRDLLASGHREAGTGEFGDLIVEELEARSGSHRLTKQADLLPDVHAATK